MRQFAGAEHSLGRGHQPPGGVELSDGFGQNSRLPNPRHPHQVKPPGGAALGFPACG